MGIIWSNKNKGWSQGFTTSLVLQGPDDTDALGSIQSNVAYQKKDTQRHSYVALKQGDVRNERTAHCLWKLARIDELIQGRDGTVRAAKIQVLDADRRSLMLRDTIQYLVPLEVTQLGTN